MDLTHDEEDARIIHHGDGVTYECGSRLHHFNHDHSQTKQSAHCRDDNYQGEKREKTRNRSIHAKSRPQSTSRHAQRDYIDEWFESWSTRVVLQRCFRKYVCRILTTQYLQLADRSYRKVSYEVLMVLKKVFHVKKNILFPYFPNT